MSEALKPCPFCGGNNVKTFGPYGWYLQWGVSHSCSAFYSGTDEICKGFNNEASAIASWNMRAGDNSATLELALQTLRWASRQLTEEHRHVLKGRAWGWRAIEKLETALAAATGTAKTPQAVECEASQSGPKGNAQPSGNQSPKGVI